MRLVHQTHYGIHTDIPDPELVDDLGRRMDVMFDQYTTALRDFKPPADLAPLPVYLFDTRRNYTAFTGVAGTNSGGLFAGGRHPYLTSFLDQNGRDGLRRALQHEAFHQFAYFVISRRLPIWLNEGMAQIFEEGIWTGETFLLGQAPPRRLRQVQADLRANRLVPFDTFLAMSPHAWAENLHANVAAGTTYYTQAWAMAHFLRYGPDAKYRQLFVEFLAKLQADPDADPMALFADSFSDPVGFQRAFERWARTARATSEATLLERQETLGDFLVGMAPKDPRIIGDMAQFHGDVVRYGIGLTYSRGGFRYATVKPPDVYFCGPDGQPFTDRQLYFKPNPGAPLPDIICKPNDAFTVQTRFYRGADHTEHEYAIEPADR